MTFHSDRAKERAAMLEQMARASATFHSQAVQLQADFDRLHAQLDLVQEQLDLVQAEIAWAPPLAPPPDMQLIEAAPYMLAALRKAVVLLAGACEHAPELRSHEAYEAVSAAIARATGCVSNFAITRPVPGAA